MRVKAHPGLCEGYGVCRRFAPAIYQLDGDGYLDLHLLEVPPGLEADAVIGAEACPARAITILHDASNPEPALTISPAPEPEACQ